MTPMTICQPAALSELPPLPDMAKELRTLLRQVPCGQVTTYGNLAKALGDRAASRWVGTYLADHSHRDSCCCHRVIRADGTVGKFAAGNPREKIARLVREGIRFHGGQIATPLEPFDAFVTNRCLERLATWQRLQVAKFSLDDDFGRVRTIGGIDVSYGPAGQCTAALVIVNSRTRRLEDVSVRTSVAKFPYIPGYLAFRELPVLLALLSSVADRPDVLLVDGAGRLHPRQCGLACLVGLLADIPTIGVAKSRLVGGIGPVEERAPFGPLRPMAVGGQCLGAAVTPNPCRRHRLYISPGHRIGLESSLRIVQRMLPAGPLPLPIRWADRISRQPAIAQSPPALHRLTSKNHA